MGWISALGGLVKLFTALFGFFRDGKLRQEGATDQANQSLQEANHDEQIARTAADSVVSDGVRIRSKFTRTEE